jgi:hypothetical protein
VLRQGVIEPEQPLLERDTGERGDETLAGRPQVVDGVAAKAIEIALGDEPLVPYHHHGVHTGKYTIPDRIEDFAELLAIQSLG